MISSYSTEKTSRKENLAEQQRHLFKISKRLLFYEFP